MRLLNSFLNWSQLVVSIFKIEEIIFIDCIFLLKIIGIIICICLFLIALWILLLILEIIIWWNLYTVYKKLVDIIKILVRLLSWFLFILQNCVVLVINVAKILLLFDLTRWHERITLYWVNIVMIKIYLIWCSRLPLNIICDIYFWDTIKFTFVF